MSRPELPYYGIILKCELISLSFSKMLLVHWRIFCKNDAKKSPLLFTALSRLIIALVRENETKSWACAVVRCCVGFICCFRFNSCIKPCRRAVLNFKMAYHRHCLGAEGENHGLRLGGYLIKNYFRTKLLGFYSK